MLLQRFVGLLGQAEATQYLVPLLLRAVAAALVFIMRVALQLRVMAVLVVAVREYCRPLEQAQEDRVILHQHLHPKEITAVQEVIQAKQAPHLVAVVEQVRLAHLHQTQIVRAQGEMEPHRLFLAAALLMPEEAGAAHIAQAVSRVDLVVQAAVEMAAPTRLALRVLQTPEAAVVVVDLPLLQAQIMQAQQAAPVLYFSNTQSHSLQ